MKRSLIAVALGASLCLPLAAAAQDGPPPGQPPGPPPAAMRATMEKVHAEAKAAAYAALSTAHAATVQSITAQVAAGTLDRRAAEKQIDDLLAPAEKTAVLAAAEKARTQMRAAMAVPPPPPPPPVDGGPPPRDGERFGPPTAGRLMVMFSLPPPGRRMTQPTARSSAAP